MDMPNKRAAIYCSPPALCMARELCFFYSKTNSCRHGLECTKSHPRVSKSRCVVVKNMYLYPRNDPSSTLSSRAVQLHLDLFYEDWFTEMSLRYGHVTDLVISSNSCHQLIGNIYIEFRSIGSALRCYEEISRRSYCGRKIVAELGVGHRISAGLCTERLCSKGESCNFIHPAPISIRDELGEAQDLMETYQDPEPHKRRRLWGE
jgi:hypothetical protein